MFYQTGARTAFRCVVVFERRELQEEIKLKVANVGKGRLEGKRKAEAGTLSRQSKSSIRLTITSAKLRTLKERV
jgi:hypothetical protein